MTQRRLVEGFWSGGRLVLWGMDTAPPVADPDAAAPPEHPGPKARPHPFALSADDVLALAGVPRDGADVSEAVLRLPGGGDRPDPPPALCAPTREPDASEAAGDSDEPTGAGEPDEPTNGRNSAGPGVQAPGGLETTAESDVPGQLSGGPVAAPNVSEEQEPGRPRGTSEPGGCEQEEMSGPPEARQPDGPTEAQAGQAEPEARPDIALLGSWTVPTVRLNGAQALAVLRRARDAPWAGPGLTATVPLLRAAEGYATAGRVVPQTVEEAECPSAPRGGAAAHARWRPVLSPDGAAWLRSYVRSLPASARAHHTPETSARWTGEAAATDILGGLRLLVDALCRERLSVRGADVPDGHGIHHQWLTALTAGACLCGATGTAGLHRLDRSLRTWFSRVEEHVGGLHLAFRLVEPPPDLFAHTAVDVSDREEDTATDEVARALPPRSAQVPYPVERTGADVDAGLDPGLGPGHDPGVEPAYEPGLDPVRDPGVDPESEPAWCLHVWVRSTGDPSLMLPLDEALAGTEIPWLPHDAASVIAAELDRAARIHPVLSGLRAGTPPARLDISFEDVPAFLTRGAPALEGAGFRVLLPSWLGKAEISTAVRLSERHGDHPHPDPTTDGGLTRSLVDFDHRVAIGGTELTREELDALVRLKSPLVRMRGEWVHVDPARLRRAAEWALARGAGTVPVEEAMRMLLHLGADASDTAGTTGPTGPSTTDALLGATPAVHADGDLGALLQGRAEEAFTPMAEPPGLTARLRPYQRRGAAWLRYLDRLGLGAVLADDMGLGKTVQLLALLADERAEVGPDGQRPAPTLLVCPTTLVGNWHKEAERFTPKLRVHVHHGTARPRGEALRDLLETTDLVVTTYGVVRRDRDDLAAQTWRRVVCDEAQAIKNARTDQSRAVRAIPATGRVALTGTPVENHLGELWSVMEFANPGLLGPREAFTSGIAVHIQTRPDSEQGRSAAARLRRVTAPFLLRRLKTDPAVITDLPDKQEMKVWCTLTPEQAALYRAVVEEMTRSIGEATGIQRKDLVLKTMTRLKQVCNHPAHLLGDGSRLRGRSGKLTQLEHLLGEMVGEGDKALCFTQYTEFGERLAPYLRERLDTEVLWLHGGVSRRRRGELVERFQDSDEPAVFLLSLKAAGTGLNLTAANQVVHVDRWWNPAVEDQATDRAHRIGQRRTVQVRKMICMGTLEERVDAMIERKKQLSESVVGSGEQWLGELGIEELREVIRLAPEAVTG
ncbi:DEAD/DEAH box helicase [Nocardiopsis sp. NRRL B-16309]|uniref:DEAD/DEAH box helicase n=1 Tax=Nocardiopsis sp. NRRL B-16309 TaxID=1519494 RepID=UPI001E5656FF|nr:SNF2-related protein [Nocardiopsis sp. NRRL B-16309]